MTRSGVALSLLVVACLLAESTFASANAQRYRVPFKTRSAIPATPTTDPNEPVVLTGIPIHTTDSPQAIINAHPAGSTFLFKTGIHRMRTISPRNGDVFNGEVGAVLNGSIQLTSFTTSGAYWRTTGNTQTQELPYRNGVCQTEQVPYRPGSGGFQKSWPRCSYNEDLFFDGVRQQHEPVLSQVGPGEWYFDYANDIIYMGSNPAGHVVETTMTTWAFMPSADNITIRRLTIEKYGSPAQRGCINAQENDGTPSRSGWKIYDSIVQLCHAGGIRIGPNMEIANTKVLRNGQIGIVGVGDNVFIHDSEVGYNNDAHYDEGWEAGGTKFVRTTNLTFRNNWVHHNVGDGFWTDIDNLTTVAEGNLLEDNTRNGIHAEVSDSAIFRNNTVQRNGFQFSTWGWGGGIVVAASRNTEIYNNRVYDNADGITLVAQDRCPPPGPRNCSNRFNYDHIVTNVDVHDNVIRQDRTSVTSDVVAAGLLQDRGDNTLFTSKNNRFYRNTYQLKSDSNYFAWQNQEGRSFSIWQGYGLDTTAGGGAASVY